MKTFTIENETNNITLHSSAKEAETLPNAECFSNAAVLAKITVDWPTSRLVEVWNSLPGEIPVKKFKDRATAVSRIWRALQSLDQAAPPAEEPVKAPEAAPVGLFPNTGLVPDPEASEVARPESVGGTAEPAPATAVGPQTPLVGPEEVPEESKATRGKKAPVATFPRDAGAPREGSKTSQVIAMLRRETGATLEEIMTAMGWQKHTTRAMLSAGGSLTKNHGLIVTSEKIGDHRKYSIKT